MLNKIIGVASLLISGAWWLGIGREFIKAVIFDRILHMLNPSAWPIATVAFQYGPPALLAVLGLYLLARGPSSGSPTAPVGNPRPSDPAAEEASLGAAVSNAVTSPKAANEHDTRAEQSSLEMQFLRKRWWYAILAGAPFFSYRAKRRLEFIDTWAMYFKDKDVVLAVNVDNDAVKLIVVYAFHPLVLEARNEIYLLVVTPEQLMQNLIATAQTELAKSQKT